MTSFAFEAFGAANQWFGARRILISSASSKTGYGIASLAHSRGGTTYGKDKTFRTGRRSSPSG